MRDSYFGTCFSATADQFGGGYPFPDPVNCRISTATNDGTSNLPDVRVFPNPFHDNLTVRWATGQSATVQLFDMAGKPVRSSEGAETVIWSTSDLSAGVYILIVGNSAFQTTYKMVKM